MVTFRKRVWARFEDQSPDEQVRSLEGRDIKRRLESAREEANIDFEMKFIDYFVHMTGTYPPSGTFVARGSERNYFIHGQFSLDDEPEKFIACVFGHNRRIMERVENMSYFTFHHTDVERKFHANKLYEEWCDIHERFVDTIPESDSDSEETEEYEDEGETDTESIPELTSDESDEGETDTDLEEEGKTESEGEGESIQFSDDETDTDDET